MHFLTLLDLKPADLETIIQRAVELKKLRQQNVNLSPLLGKVLVMLFDKASTRTRVAFETAMAQLGGSTIFLSKNDSQLSRGEPIEDSARVISSMADIIVIRTFAHSQVELFSKYSSVPVINGLTDDYHPCQLLADIQTYYELRGSIRGKTVTWIGDGNNMCHSYINAAKQFDFQLHIACPKGYQPNQELVNQNQERVKLFADIDAAVNNVDLIVTDVWASMGSEHQQEERVNLFKDFQVTEAVLDQANKDVLFMHCLPAHRGEEISATLLEDQRSVVWQEAENRLHAHKALLEFLLVG